MAVIAMLICLSGYGDELRVWTSINALFFTGALAMAMPSIFAAMRDWRADRWIGKFSYPAYLVHMRVMRSEGEVRTIGRRIAKSGSR